MENEEKVLPLNEEIKEMDYEILLKSLIESSTKVGQLVWVDKLSDRSNQINIVRELSDGKKQLFTIVVSNVDSLIMKA